MHQKYLFDGSKNSIISEIRLENIIIIICINEIT